MSHIAAFNNEKAFLRKFLIFIVFSATILLSFASCGKTEEGKSAETETDEKAETEHVTETETSAATETYVPDDNFVTIDGVLTEYKGTDTVVTIPDYVTEIADRAFEDAPNAGKITEIRLGRGVTKISAKAFFGLDALIKIETGENPYFEEFSFDNRDIYPLDGEYFPTVYALSSFCQPIIFCFGYELNGILDFLTETDYYIEKENITIVISNALLDIKINDSPFGYYCVLNVITYENYIKKYDSFSLDGVDRFRAFETEEAFVFSKATNNFAETYLFACGKIFEVNGNTDYTIRFFKKDGQLKYCKMPCKYSAFTNGHGVTNFFLIYNEIMSRTELCSEYGRVETDENGPVYIPERTYNLTEQLLMLGKDIDECFEKYYCEGEYDTLDELIEANRKKIGNKFAQG